MFEKALQLKIGLNTLMGQTVSLPKKDGKNRARVAVGHTSSVMTITQKKSTA